MRKAFTLIEILVVLAIMALATAAAVPTIRLLSGSHSLAWAQNEIAAMLGNARTTAINTGHPCGIVIATRTDGSTFRSMMIPIAAGTQGDDPDPNLRYMGWTPSAYHAASGTLTADRVTFITRDGDDPSGFRPLVAVYRCIRDAGPSDQPPVTATGLRWGNDYWQQVLASDMDVSSDKDIQMLPDGVGAACTMTGDQYALVGAVVFDAQGRLSSKPITIWSGSHLAGMLGAASDQTFTPSLVLSIFDRSEFDAQPVANRNAWIAANGTNLAIERGSGQLIRN
jgi:prepilin-type N-terminal cleavage/methylation domain-containing protein